MNNFWGFIISISVISYLYKKLQEKYCNFFTEIIRLCHHFSTCILFFGIFAPIDSLIYVLLLSICALSSWIFANNTCFLTTIERIQCGYKKSYRFEFISEQMDKFILKYRIGIMIFIICILCVRLWNT